MGALSAANNEAVFVSTNISGLCTTPYSTHPGITPYYIHPGHIPFNITGVGYYSIDISDIDISSNIGGGGALL